MPIQRVLQTTTFNMKLRDENGENGYNWCKRLNLSIQSRDARLTMREIINMIKLNGYSIDILIKLENNNIIKFRNNIV